MERLPIEILHFIFIQLPLRQRLECTLVSCQWSDLLRKRSLFHTITMEDEEICKSFLEMIQRFPARALQVEILRLNNCPDTTFDKRKFCNIFPKARIIEITSSRSSGSFTHFSKRPVEFIVSKTQITHLADYDEGELAFELMATGRCSRLTFLQLQLNPSYDSILHYVPMIKNLPVLKELHLYGLYMRLDDMETIHDNIPTLKTLSLAWFTMEPSILPLDIKPAAITKFHLEARGFDEQMDKQVMWLNYVQQKYPALTELEFWCRGNEDHATASMLDFYGLGVMPIVKALGSQLSTVPTLSVPDELDVFKQFDEYGCQLQECVIKVEERVSVVDRMAQSAQAKSIQKLHIFYLMHPTFKWLSEMKKLKDLELTYNYVSPRDYEEEKASITNIGLNALLEQCPDSLETLTINNTNLTFTYANNTHSLSSVKKLTLKNVVLPRGADRYLANFFPKLTSLRLEECIFANGGLSLPKHHLSSLEVITRNKTNAMIDVSLKTKDHNQPRLYPAKPQTFFVGLYKGNDIYINPTEHELVSFTDDIRIRVYFKLEVASVKSLIVNRLYYSTS